MSFIGSSLLNTFQFIQRGGGDRGPIGPTGPTGNTGPTGPTGNTGATGTGVYSIEKINTDTIRIWLGSAAGVTYIDVTGVSGPAPSASDVGTLTFDVQSAGAVGSNSVLLINSITNNQANFKVFSGDGITFSYSGNDLVISAPSIVGAGSLQNNTVLGVSGITGIVFFNTDNKPAFTYNKVQSGITYYELVDTTIGPFLQAISNNINATGAAVNLANADIVINQFYYDTSSSSWKNKNTIKLSGADLLNNNQTISFTDEVFTNSQGITYPFIEAVGSCCFCNIFGDRVAGPTYSDRMCIDYVTKNACDSIGGSFSEATSCLHRATEAGCASIGSAGVCCTCGTNNATGTNSSTCVAGTILDETKCKAIFGDAAWHPLQTCSAVSCPSPCGTSLVEEKKKLVQTSERGYPSRFTCAIDQNGDVVCWGPLVSAKTYAVSGDGYYAKQIAVGENQVVILAYKKNEDGTLDENDTKVYSYSFLKSLLENKVQANSNIFRAAFANFSENEYFKSGFNSVIFKRGGYYDAEKYPANREAMFIGLKYPDQTLFASGRIVDKDDTNLVNNGVEALVPLPEGAYKEVAANTQHVCGIRADNGSIVCWGANDFGQSDAPAEYREFDSVAVGRFHTVALRKNGDVVCWGAGSTSGNGGALANSDVWPNYGQSKVPSDLLGKQVIQVGAGYYYSAALLVDGTVKVWGSFRGYTYSPSEGASDLPDTYRFLRDDINRGIVNQPAGLNSIKEIVCTPYSIIGLKDDGSLVSWGDDSSSNGLTGGFPTMIPLFYNALDRFGIQKNKISFEQIAADDKSIFGLQNVYGCPGVTFIRPITTIPTTSSGSGPGQVTSPGGGRDTSKVKTLLMYKKSFKGCINCIETTEDKYNALGLKLVNEEGNYVGITYPWETGASHIATNYSQYSFTPVLTGYNGDLNVENNFKCYDGITHIWFTIHQNDPNGQTLPLRSSFFNDDGSLYSGCDPLAGCSDSTYGSLVKRNLSKACLNCNYASQCEYEDIQGLLGISYARFYEGSVFCYDTINKKYIWETDSTELPNSFKDFDGNILSACADLDNDGLSNNDEDDICDTDQQILTEQYIWEINIDNVKSSQWPNLEPQIHNVKCLNRNENDQFWSPANIAYKGSSIVRNSTGLCYRKTNDILTNKSFYRDIKQEIFLLSNSGNGVYYVMKPDSTYIDGNKIVNYGILNAGKIGFDSSQISYLSGNLGYRSETLLINDKAPSRYGWKNSELVTDPKSSLGYCDPNINTFFDRDFNSNNNCGLESVSPTAASFYNYDSRRVLGGAFGYGHGMYIIAGAGCIEGSTLEDCSTGYVVSTRNATGLTALNSKFQTTWTNPTTKKEEGTFVEQTSKFWLAATGPVKIAGITYEIQDTGNPGLNTPNKILKDYNSSSGYYHSCVVLDQELNINGITYQSGDVACWGVGEDPKRINSFNYKQAYIQPFTDGLTALQVSCGKFHTAVLMSNNQLRMFGAGSDSTIEGFNYRQCLIPNIFANLTFEKISSGSYHTIGVYDGNKVLGWGKGNGYLDTSLTDYSIKTLNYPPIKVASGNAHNVFLSNTGLVECSGSNESNQCQICTDPLYNKKRYVWIDAKEDTTLAVDIDNVLYIFGGIKNNVEAVPEDIANPPPNRRVISVSTGEDHSLALLGYKDDPLNYGEIRGWGYSPELSVPPQIQNPHITTGSSSNTSSLVYGTDRRQLKLIGDGSYVPYVQEKVYQLGLIGSTGISIKTIDQIIADGGADGTTATEYFNFIRKEKLKDPKNTSFGISKIAAGGLRSFAIRSVPDLKYGQNDIPLYSYIIPWGRSYVNMPQALESLFTSPEFITQPGKLYVKRFLPTEIKASNLFVGVRIQELLLDTQTDTLTRPQDKICIYYDADVAASLEQQIGTVSTNPIYGDLKFLSYTEAGKTYNRFSNYSVGAFHIIAIIDEPGDVLHGTVATWGFKNTQEDYGQFEIPKTTEGIRLQFKDISAGKYHNIGILLDNTVYCWGAGMIRDLENPDDIINLGQSIVPIDSQGRSIKAKTISAGGYHSLAIDLDDNVIAWGAGSSLYSEFSGGKPHTGQSIVPSDKDGNPIKAISISAGDYHSLAVTTNNIIEAWGSNDNNEISTAFADNEKFVEVAAGSGYSLAITSGGGVVGWGYGSNESPEATTVGGNNRLFGAQLLSAAPPRETTDISIGDEYPYQNNRFGENNLILFNDFRVRDKAIRWGDNSFNQWNIPKSLLINDKEITSPEYYPFNLYNKNEEGDSFNYLQSTYNISVGYGSYYFSGNVYVTGNTHTESFIIGSGLNSGIDYYAYKTTGIKRMWPVSKIDGITGVNIPIFSDLFSAETYSNKLGQQFESRVNSPSIDEPSFYYGVGPEDFYFIKSDGKIYRSDIPAYATRTTTDAQLRQPSKDEGITFTFYELSGDYSKFKNQIGINWGLKVADDRTITVGEYDWKDAYAFALGWNPFTNQPVNYFDLHHNLWNIKPSIKSKLNTSCTNCALIQDIKNGFTPLESISGRYGLRVVSDLLSSSNLHGNFRTSTKVCGKLDLTDPSISPFVYHIIIQDKNGNPIEFYLLDSVLLFGDTNIGHVRHDFPFALYGTPTERKEWIKDRRLESNRLTYIENIQNIFDYGHLPIFNYAEKAKASWKDNAVCNALPTARKQAHDPKLDTDTPFNAQRWLMIPKPETNDTIQICFRVNGICSFGDNSKGQLGGLDTGRSIADYKPKPWIPSFLLSYGNNIKSGFLHSLLNTREINTADFVYKTYVDPVIKYRLFGWAGGGTDWNDYFIQGRLNENTIESVFNPALGSTLSPSHFIFTGKKPVFKERYITVVECGRDVDFRVPSYVFASSIEGETLGGFNRNFDIQDVLKGNVKPADVENEEIFYAAGTDHIGFVYNNEYGMTLAGATGFGKKLNVYPEITDFGIQLNSIKPKQLSIGANHNLITSSQYIPYNGLKIIEAKVNTDSVEYTTTNIDGTSSYIIDYYGSSELTELAGQTVTWFIQPRNDSHQTTILLWGDNTSGQVYSSSDLSKLKPKQLPILEQTGDVYTVTTQEYSSLNKTNKISSGTNHNTFIIISPNPSLGLGPNYNGTVARVSQGFTYANYGYEVITTGNNSKDQTILPEELDVTRSGKKVFEFNSGSNKIIEIAISMNNQYIAYALDNGIVVVLNKNDALNGVYSTPISPIQTGETINTIKFAADNTLYVGCASGKLIAYNSLKSDNIIFTLNAPISNSTKILNWRNIDPTSGNGWPISLADKKYLDILDRSNLFGTDPSGNILPLKISAIKSDGTTETFPQTKDYSYNEYLLDIGFFTPDVSLIEDVYSSILIQTPSPAYYHTTTNFGVSVNKISISKDSLDQAIVVGLQDGTVAYRKLKDAEWKYLSYQGNDPVTAMDMGDDYNLLAVGHRSGIINGWKPFEINKPLWSSKSGSLSKSLNDDTINSWCDTPRGITICPGSLNPRTEINCLDNVDRGECVCFRSGEITSLSFVGYKQRYTTVQRDIHDWEPIIFTAKMYDDLGNPIYPAENKCNPQNYLSPDPDNPSVWFGAEKAFRKMAPSLKSQIEKAITTKKPATIGKIYFSSTVNSQGYSVFPRRSYLNTEHLEYNNAIHEKDNTFDIDTGYTGGTINVVKASGNSRKIYTIGSDNDVRIERQILSNIADSPEAFDTTFYEGIFEKESNICNGDRLSDGSPDKDKQITACEIFADETHIVTGTTSGILRIWNTENKSILNSHPDLKINNISSGENHTCISYSIDGTYSRGLLCWGDNTYKQCDIPQTYSNISTKSYFTNGVHDSGRIFAGGNNTCVMYGYSPFCWGRNEANQLSINNKPQFADSIAIGDGFIAAVGNLSVNSDCPDTSTNSGGGTINVYGRNAETFNATFLSGAYLYLVAAKNSILAKYDPRCGYTGPIYTEAWDIYGNKQPCYSDPNVFNETSQTGLDTVYFSDSQILKRYDIDGFETVYTWGDNTYDQCKWPLDKSFVGFTGISRINSSRYHPQDISSQETPTCSNCWSENNVGYLAGCGPKPNPTIGNQSDGTNQIEISTVDIRNKTEMGSPIYVGGYHNIITFADSFGSSVYINPISRPLIRLSAIGWGRNDYNQSDITNIPPSSTPILADNTGSGIIAASKYATIATSYDNFYGTGYTLAGQLKNTPQYTDFGIGNGYAFFAHESGYILDNIPNNYVFKTAFRASRPFIDNAYFPRCGGSIYAPVRTFRTIKKIRTGKDFALFITNEGKVVTTLCYNGYSVPLPRHFTTVTLSDFNLNTPPTTWRAQPMKDVQIGHFHVIGLTNKNSILMWGVSPDKQFNRQYYQTVIPPSIINSTNIVQISAGKYHSAVIAESVTDTTYFRKLISFGEPGNNLE